MDTARSAAVYGLRRTLALRIDLPAQRLNELAADVSLERMRARADDIVPSASTGMWKSVAGFLCAGAAGEWRDRVTDGDAVVYDERVAALVPADLARWVHLGRRQSGIDPSLRP